MTGPRTCHVALPLPPPSIVSITGYHSPLAAAAANKLADHRPPARDSIFQMAYLSSRCTVHRPIRRAHLSGGRRQVSAPISGIPRGWRLILWAFIWLPPPPPPPSQLDTMSSGSRGTRAAPLSARARAPGPRADGHVIARHVARHLALALAQLAESSGVALTGQIQVTNSICLISIWLQISRVQCGAVQIFAHLTPAAGHLRRDMDAPARLARDIVSSSPGHGYRATSQLGEDFEMNSAPGEKSARPDREQHLSSDLIWN